MSDPKLTGNRAEEMAEYESGKDFDGISVATPPPDGEVLEVDATKLGDHILITPKRNGTASAYNGPGEVQESEKDQIAAQIFDDPKMNARVSGAVTRKADRGQLQFYAFRSNMAAAVAGDRVKIKRDTMESIYSCRSCKGLGHGKEVCPTCKGTRIDIDGKSDCRSCKVLGYDREVWRSAGFVQCESCRGAGSPAGIVIPESAKSAPISGIIVSCGPWCKLYQLGDHVLHSRYAGHTLVTPDGEEYTTMHEHEVLELLKEL
jgi:co-chaperonin GroES (HSP10)